MSVNISLIVLKKMYDILMILVDFCENKSDNDSASPLSYVRF